MSSGFIKEKIKDRPVNKKKLIVRFFTTVFLAAVFGVVAAVCFYYTMRSMETVRGEEKPQEINLSSEESISSDEAVSEDEAGEADGNTELQEYQKEEKTEPRKTVINNITNKVLMTPESYEKLYASLHETAEEAARSIVTVTGSVSNTDWFDNTYENSSNGAGLIIAQSDKELMILTAKNITDGAEKVSVSFVNGETVDARIVKADANTGLETVGVSLDDISSKTKEIIETAKLGSSGGSLVGTPVIAIGNPFGIRGSEGYGLVTSSSEEEQMTDMNTHLITTDIYGSANASGVLINYSGRVMGIITTRYGEEDTKNIITAYSISDMRALLERLANDRDAIYMGIYGTDVTDEAAKDLGIPKGAYVTSTIAGSPAMASGIQSGDVIVEMGDRQISNFADYSRALGQLKPDEDVNVTVQRYSRGEYQEMKLEATVTSKE
ncbi:MAG: S1C family serine protease [Lachnospiraceae bacterium]|nr:S1C family serine protease [Lachnospiraceae bacterium]